MAVDCPGGIEGLDCPSLVWQARTIDNTTMNDGTRSVQCSVLFVWKKTKDITSNWAIKNQ